MAFPTSRRGVESITVLKPHSQEQQFNFPIFGTFLRFFFSFRAAGCDFHLQIIKHTPKRYLYLSLFYDDIFRFRSLIANFSPIPGLSLIHWFLFHFYKHIKLPQNSRRKKTAPQLRSHHRLTDCCTKLRLFWITTELHRAKFHCFLWYYCKFAKITPLSKVSCTSS